MPNRMLRDWTNSDRINGLSIHAERFFTRLIMKVDDYGCFYADSRLLKANLYPLLLDTIRDADLLRWMAECRKAGLIIVYENLGKRYLQIVDFRQRLDKARHKFPLPIDTDIPESVNEFPGEQKEKTEVELETEEKGNAHARERILGVFNAEEEILKNQIRFEQIVMNAGREVSQGREILHSFHLYLESKDQYPKTKKSVFAGFEKWINDEKKFERNGTGTHQRNNSNGSEKLGTSEARIDKASKWGS